MTPTRQNSISPLASPGPCSVNAASRRVVVVSAIAPPQPNAGAARLEALVSYLPQFGWQPIVVSSRFAGEGSIGAATTYRVGDPLYWYRRLHHGSGEFNGVPRELEHVARAAGGLTALLAQLVDHSLPDQFVGWVPGAALATIRAIRKQGAHAIVSTSPPESSHLAALIAAYVTRVPWLAEFRDGWMFEGLRPAKSRLRSRIEQQLEELVCRRASMLVGATRGIAADLAHRYGRGEWVSNGFDDETLPASAFSEARSLLDPRYFNVVYTGTFWVSRQTQSPNIVAETMELVRVRPEGDRIRMTIMGALHPDERALLEPISGIRLERHRPRPVALALQRLADALVVVGPANERAVVPGKFFEYLGSGRPMIVVADKDTELAQLARELNVAATISTNDPAELATTLLALATGNLKPPALETPERFHRRHATADLANLLTEISGSRRPS